MFREQTRNISLLPPIVMQVGLFSKAIAPLSEVR